MIKVLTNFISELIIDEELQIARLLRKKLLYKIEKDTAMNVSLTNFAKQNRIESVSEKKTDFQLNNLIKKT